MARGLNLSRILEKMRHKKLVPMFHNSGCSLNLTVFIGTFSPVKVSRLLAVDSAFEGHDAGEFIYDTYIQRDCNYVDLLGSPALRIKWLNV